VEPKQAVQVNVRKEEDVVSKTVSQTDVVNKTLSSTTQKQQVPENKETGTVKAPFVKLTEEMKKKIVFVQPNELGEHTIPVIKPAFETSNAAMAHARAKEVYGLFEDVKDSEVETAALVKAPLLNPEAAEFVPNMGAGCGRKFPWVCDWVMNMA
jgi:hypothetical protein